MMLRNAVSRKNCSSQNTCQIRAGGRARRRIAVIATLLSDVSTKTTSTHLEQRSAVAEEDCLAKNPLLQAETASSFLPERHTAAPVTLAMLKDIRTLFNSMLKEYAYWVDETWVTGTIPPELRGTYYRNGPGLHVTNPRFNRHTLDGDGMVFSLAFKDGRAYFRNRFVRTKGFVEEQAVGRPLHRNSFTRGAADGSFPFNPFDLSFKNVANTGVLPWAGQLFALWEAGLPYLLDSRTLDTIRETRMGGQIRTNTFSAHYHIVTERKAKAQRHPQEHHQNHQQSQSPRQQFSLAPPPAGPAAANCSSWPSISAHHIHHHHLGPQGIQQQQQQPQRDQFSFFQPLHFLLPSQSPSPSSSSWSPPQLHQQGPTHHAFLQQHHRKQQQQPFPSTGKSGGHSANGTSWSRWWPSPPDSTTSQQHQRHHHHPSTLGPEDLQDATGAADTSTSRRLVTFSNEFGFGGCRAVFYEFDEAGLLLHETQHTLPGIDIALIHDMVVTEHYYVLVVGPVKMDPIKFGSKYILGGCSIAECLVFDERQPTRIMVFPRPGRPSGKVLAPRVLETDPCFVFHHVNGWEVQEEARGDSPGPRQTAGLQLERGSGPELLVIDTVAWDEVDFDLTLFDKHSSCLDGFVGGARAQLTRLTCDLRTGRVERLKLLQRTVEFPAMDPRVTSRPHSVAWFISDVVNHPVLWGPPQAIVRLELDPHLSLPSSSSSTATSSSSPSGQQRSQSQVLGSFGDTVPPLAPPRPSATAARGPAAGAAPGVAVDCWYLGERTFPGEPMFVPRPGSTREGEGWLIVAVHDAATEKANVHIFDAEALSAGPLATLHLPHRLPMSLHGAWDETYLGPDPQDPSVPQWQELGSVRPL